MVKREIPRKCFLFIVYFAFAIACDVYSEDSNPDRGEASRVAGTERTEGLVGNGDANTAVIGLDRAGDSGPDVKSTPDSATSGGTDGNGLEENGATPNQATVNQATVAKGCGDGLVSADEACDILIDKGEPGACPRSDEDCPRGDECVQWKLNDKGGCQVACRKWEPLCENGDGCCPTACTYRNDSDCSSDCGDGILQEGEVCEPAIGNDGRSLPMEIPACPTKCEDDGDGDPCTTLELTGSEANCTASCKSASTNELKSGDGCCPQGADYNKDNDCPPVCGNGIREANEECDGTSNCNANCTSIFTPDQETCIDKFIGYDITEECRKCQCTNCSSEILACIASDDEVKNAQCDAISKCANENGCLNEACYCGDAVGYAVGWCILGYTPNGPCRTVIEQAIGTTDLMTMATMVLNPDSTLGRVQAVSDCYAAQCVTVCDKTTPK